MVLKFIQKGVAVSLAAIALLVAGVVFAAAPDGAAGPWADNVVDASQGSLKNGGLVAANRSDPSAALGPAESLGTPYDNPVVAGSFFSLGFQGSITLSFENSVLNGDGADFQLYEVTGGSSYPDEQVNVEASHNGIDWVQVADHVTRDATIDLGDVLSCAQFVRITDVSDESLFESTADGYDLDGVLALHTDEGACDLSAEVSIEKSASSYEVFPGEEVTYTYTVSNPGDFDLDGVNVTDDKCSPVTYVSGDDGDDGVLGVDEVWTYECTMALDESTTNIADVSALDPFDNEVTDSAEASVAVKAPGCTLTQGYWKTHSEYGKAPYDDTWASLSDGADTLLPGSSQTWYEVFWTPPKKGNVWYQLAHQWMAAYLNVENEANPLALGGALADAEAWLNAHSPEEGLKGKDAANAKAWASLFASYNEGDIGPGHCGD